MRILIEDCSDYNTAECSACYDGEIYYDELSKVHFCNKCYKICVFKRKNNFIKHRK